MPGDIGVGRVDGGQNVMESPIWRVLAGLLASRRASDLLIGCWSARTADLALGEQRAEELTLEKLLRLILRAADFIARTNPSAEEVLRATSDLPDELSSLVGRVAETWAVDLSDPLGSLQCFERVTGRSRNRPTSLDVVHGEGQFSWGGSWSFTNPGESLHDDLLAAWDNAGGTMEFEVLDVGRQPRVFEVNEPADWAELAITYRDSRSSPGAARPRWPEVAESFDAIHLSWLGFSLVHDNQDAAVRYGVVPLRYWGSERTHWLRAPSAS